MGKEGFLNMSILGYIIVFCVVEVLALWVVDKVEGGFKFRGKWYFK